MKNNPMSFRAAALLVCMISVLATSSTAQAILPDQLANLLKKKGIPSSSVSILIKEAGASMPLVSHLADTPRNPASTMKLLTTIAALDLLGPSYQWETKTYLSGTLKAGTLKGDLVLKGSGDPWFVIERFWKLLKNLQAQGLKRIDGDLVVDELQRHLLLLDCELRGPARGGGVLLLADGDRPDDGAQRRGRLGGGEPPGDLAGAAGTSVSDRLPAAVVPPLDRHLAADGRADGDLDLVLLPADSLRRRH